MRKEVTFRDLERVLLTVGFVITHGPGPHKLYTHPSFDAKIVLPPHQAKETVRLANLVAVRRTLSENGVLDPDSFDRLLEEVIIP